MNQSATHQSFDAKRFVARYGKEGHNGMLGLQYVSNTSTTVVLAMPFVVNLAGDGGGLADEAIASLIDFTATVSVWVRVDKFRPHATLDLRVDHVAEAPAGKDVVAMAECFQVAGDIAFVRGEARAGEDTVAQFMGTYMFLDKK
jgi:acyl-coenzyme A thioesterase PaaI-like protein